MRSDDVLEVLRAHRSELARQGVLHAALFGSTARGEAKPSSDIDIMIDLDPSIPLSVYDYVELRDYIAGLFNGPVDIVNRRGMKPYIALTSMDDAIYAF